MATHDTSVSTLRHFIDGERVAGEGNRFGDVHDPATGTVRARVPFATAGGGRQGGPGREGGVSRMGRDPRLAARAHPVPLP